MPQAVVSTFGIANAHCIVTFAIKVSLHLAPWTLGAKLSAFNIIQPYSGIHNLLFPHLAYRHAGGFIAPK